MLFVDLFDSHALSQQVGHCIEQSVYGVPGMRDAVRPPARERFCYLSDFFRFVIVGRIHLLPPSLCVCQFGSDVRHLE